MRVLKVLKVFLSQIKQTKRYNRSVFLIVASLFFVSCSAQASEKSVSEDLTNTLESANANMEPKELGCKNAHFISNNSLSSHFLSKSSSKQTQSELMRFIDFSSYALDSAIVAYESTLKQYLDEYKTHPADVVSGFLRLLSNGEREKYIQQVEQESGSKFWNSSMNSYYKNVVSNLENEVSLNPEGKLLKNFYEEMSDLNKRVDLLNLSELFDKNVVLSFRLHQGQVNLNNFFEKEFSDLNINITSRFSRSFLEILDPKKVIFSYEDQKEMNSFSKFPNCYAFKSNEKKIKNTYMNALNFLDNIDTDQLKAEQSKKESFPEYSDYAQTKSERDQRLQIYFYDKIKTLKIKKSLTFEVARDKVVQNFKAQLSVFTDELDMEHLFLNSILKSLDPHSQFYNSEETEKTLKSFAKPENFFGVGVSIKNQEEEILVQSVIPGGPSAKSGLLKAGDIIVSVWDSEKSEDWKNVSTFSGDDSKRLQKFVEYVKGREGSRIKIRFRRGDHIEKEVEIIRGKVEISLGVEVKTVNGVKVGVIQLDSFYDGSEKDIEVVVKQALDRGVQSLVLDLTNTGGGSLRAALGILDLFLDKPSFLFQAFSQDASLAQDVSRGKEGVLYKGPLTVLVNTLSASASEIVSGVLQVYERAIIVGERTHGKGSVQRLLPYRWDSLFLEVLTKITEALYFLPNGESPQFQGISPDVEVPSAEVWNTEDNYESSFLHAIEPITMESILSPREEAGSDDVVWVTKDFRERLAEKSQNRLFSIPLFQERKEASDLQKKQMGSLEKEALVQRSKEVEKENIVAPYLEKFFMNEALNVAADLFHLRKEEVSQKKPLVVTQESKPPIVVAP